MLEWAEKIKSSVSQPVPEAPGFPPAYIQERFVGRSGQAAIEEVIPFAQIVSDIGHLTLESKVLDFGVGWGRIARLFQKTVSSDNLYLADVDPEALSLCKETRVRGQAILLDPSGSLPFNDGFFDAIYSYSVFSHLAEASAKHWFRWSAP
ncbi:class I SAM-dependent methyltransferase [Daeguia caeni]|uniref:Class I SAM-dependent methyltransferase n=1 Tax=Daeguia caeni TaxID=439612 RepID=A0ABV9H2I9_9HYPH